MRPEEAAWIGEKVRALGARTVLNLGSGSRRFREVSKPYIDRQIFDPLVRAGARVIHADLKEGEGIEVSGDLFDPAVQGAPGRDRAAVPCAPPGTAPVPWQEQGPRL